MAKNTGFGIDGCQKEYSDRDPVVNQVGSSNSPRCGCGSWLNHWRLYAVSDRAKCVYMGCSSEAAHGAHVQFATKHGNSFSGRGPAYIVPLCAKHNNPNHKGPFFISVSCELVDEKAREECSTAEYRLNKQNYFHMRIARASGRIRCGCTDLWSHYEIVAKSKRQRCVAIECGRDAIKAVPMRSLDRRTDRDAWIAPVCAVHARQGSEIFIKRKAPVANPKRSPDCPGA